MAEVTGNQIELTEELQKIGSDIEGVRKVQTLYGNMLSENYEVFLLADRNKLKQLKTTIESILASGLKEDEDGGRQYILVVNEVTENTPIVYMAKEMNTTVIDRFKDTLPLLDDTLEQKYIAKKQELDEL